MLFFSLLFASLGLSSALYGPGSPVKVLDAQSFDKARKKHPLMLVEFFAPWCGHCQSLAPIYETVARSLEGLVPVYAVNADEEQALGSEFGIQGFPTIKLVSQKGAVDFKGERLAASIINWTMDQATKFVQKRAGVAPKGAKSAKAESSSGSGSGSAGSDKFFGAKSGVVALKDDNFDSEVLEGKEGWFVMFYAPWCGHCQQAKPDFAGAAKDLSDEQGVRFGAVDCTEGGQEICSRFGIKGFPTFKFFGENKKRPLDYQGGRNRESLAEYAKEHSEFARAAIPNDVVELTGHHTLEEKCLGDSEGKGAKQLCVIAFLPDLLDSKAAGRNKYIQVLEALRDSAKGKPYSFLWAEGARQPELEANFGVGGFGYPALIAFGPKRKTFVVSTDAFSAEASKDFLRRVSNGFVRPQPIFGELAEVREVAPWDGGEAELIEEEEIPLEELMKDEF